MSASSDRIRRIRSRIDFLAKVAGTTREQSSKFLTSASYGGIVSQENGCCDPPLTNYAAYFTVQEPGRGVVSAFDIPADSAFTIEWWQQDVSANELQSRNIFSFGSFTYGSGNGQPEFACVFDQGSIIVRIAGINYPLFPNTIDYGSFESLLVPNHFAIVRGAAPEQNIRVYKNGAFLGEFTYGDAIPITNIGSTQFTIRNQTTACALAQMYGDLASFRWTASELYTGYNYNPVGNFAPPAIPLAPLAQNVFTFNDFPTSGSATSAEGFTVTHHTPDNLPACQ